MRKKIRMAFVPIAMWLLALPVSAQRVLTLDDMKDVAWSTIASIGEVQNDNTSYCSNVYDLQGRIVKTRPTTGFFLRKDAKSGRYTVAHETVR